MADQSTSSQEVLTLLNNYLCTILTFSNTFIPLAEEVKRQIFPMSDTSSEDDAGNKVKRKLVDADILPTDDRQEIVKTVGSPLQSAIDALRQLCNIRAMLHDSKRIGASRTTGHLTRWHTQLVKSLSDDVILYITDSFSKHEYRMPDSWKFSFTENALGLVKREWRAFREELEDLQTEASRSIVLSVSLGGSKDRSPSPQAAAQGSITAGAITIPFTTGSSHRNELSLYAGRSKRKHSATPSPSELNSTEVHDQARRRLSEHGEKLTLGSPFFQLDDKTPPMDDQQIDVVKHADELASALRFELQIEKIDDVWDISLLSLITTDQPGPTPSSSRYLEPPSPSHPAITVGSDGGYSGGSSEFDFDREVQKM